MNIYQRLNEVKKEVHYVQKDSRVQGYKAVTHDMVTAATREALVKNGVIVTQSLMMSEFNDTGTTTSNGTPIKMYQASYQIDFINTDEPQDRLSVVVESQALDQGDKASGKAMSYAMKYALLKTLGLETGENEESRVEQFERKKQQVELINNEQIEAIKSLAEKTQTDINNLLSFYKVNSLEEMNQVQRADLQGKLSKKLKKQAEKGDE